MSSGVSTTSAPASGMRDFSPADVALRDWATQRLLNTYHRFGFTRIETPVVENIANLRGGEGGENLALIFEIMKRGDKLDKVISALPVRKEEIADLGLRFDLTVPLVRFYSHYQNSLPSPFKAIQIGSVFRAESPQVGRYRQFTQCDIDTFGIKSETAEIELIQATSEALLDLSFETFTVRLNDRRILGSLAEACGFETARHDNLFIQIDKLDKIGVKGVSSELSNQGHPKQAVGKLVKVLEEFGAATAGANTSPSQFLSGKTDPAVVAGLEMIISSITAIAGGKFNIEFDPTLVRGMGYYTGPIFEIRAPGYSSSIAGGGRYDKMVGKMSGRDVPAVGFSIGFERIISILSEKNSDHKHEIRKLAFIFDPDRDEATLVFKKAQELRSAEQVVSLLPRKKDMRKQLDALTVQGFSSYAMMRGSELEIKNLNG